MARQDGDPTFHPAAILHGGGEKSRQFGELREDFELVRDTLASMRPAAQAPGAAPARASSPAPVQVPDPAPVRVPDADVAPAPEEQLELF